MVVLREGMCPGLDDGLVRGLRAAGIKTGELFVCFTLMTETKQHQQ